MDDRDVQDERLAALADGELSAAEAAALRAEIAENPRLAERFASFVETRELLAPEPKVAADAGHDRLTAAIRAADGSRRPSFSVIEGGVAPREAAAPRLRSAPRFRVAAPALAACLALAVGGALGFAVGRSGTRVDAAGGIAAVSGALASDAALASALERTPSGERLAWTDEGAKLRGAVSIVSTRRLGDGRVCREYEVSVDGRDGAAVGLGCRGSGGAWRTEFLVQSAPPGGGYATASGATMLESAIETLGGEGALPPAEEKALLASSWEQRAP